MIVLDTKLLITILCCTLLICICSFAGAAQSRDPAKDLLPRVGTIKDYQATGLAAGCAICISAEPRTPDPR